MDISTLLGVSQINLTLRAQNKQQALAELTDLLVEAGVVNNKVQFLQDVWLREQQGPTGFDNQIAIPHGQSSAVRYTSLAIGRSQQDIAWDTGSQVRCILLYAVSLDEQNMQRIRLLTQVSCALADDQVIAQLLSENDPQKIIELLDRQTQDSQTQRAETR